MATEPRSRVCLQSLLVVALLASPAQATLIDLGDVTRDTSSGLDWLDLTASQGYSIAEVLAGEQCDSADPDECFPLTFLSDGWAFATRAQVCALFADNAVAPDPCLGGVQLVSVPGNVSEGLAELLGITGLGPNSKESDGFFYDGPDQGGLAFVYYNFTNDESQTGTMSLASTFKDETWKEPGIGNFLIRPIPEPVSALFVAAGLVALSAARRARR